MLTYLHSLYCTPNPIARPYTEERILILSSLVQSYSPNKVKNAHYIMTYSDGWFDATQNNQMWLFLASNDVYKSDSAAVIFGHYYILNSWTIWQ